MSQYATFAVRIVAFSICIVIKVILFTTYKCEAQAISKSFYIRHYSGKCLNYNTAKQAFVFQSVCRDKFRWKGGVRLIHTATKKCVVPQSSAVGSLLTTSDQCTGTDSIFQYYISTKMMKHAITSRCLRPDSASDPPEDATVALKPGSFYCWYQERRTRMSFYLHCITSATLDL